MVILDLEDAVKPELKDAAREAAVAAVAEAWPCPVAIRINGIGTIWHEADTQAVAASAADFAILPRVSQPDLFADVQDRVRKPLLAMIESAAGVLNAAAIAREAAALIAGTNDLASDLRLPRDSSRAPLQTALQMIVLAARAAGIAAFDGVFNRFADEAGLIAECREGRALGFDGKTLIHPAQIAPCHTAFAPSDEELDRARRLVAAATGGAERFEDEMIERMHVEAAQRLLERVTG